MLFICELANNHNGDINRGKEIISRFSEITKEFPQFTFAMKFQRRELNTFLHPDYRNSLEIPYIKRFVENQITKEELKELKEYAESLGYLTICTPFDEAAVDTVKSIGFSYIKIGSCSFTDWPLLNKVADANMPVIASMGGASYEDIHKVSSFFNNRQIPLILMYCVGLYPTEIDQVCLSKIDELQQEFSCHQIGFSTHEHPDNYDIVKMAIAKHITIFEKHIDLDTCCPVDMFVKRNAYSINPKEFRKYLEAADIAQKICQENKVAEGLEKDKLRTLQRGAFLKRDAKQGDIIGRDDLFFAFPIIHNFQYSAGTCSKYVSFQVMKDVKQNEPLTSLNSNIVDNTKIIESIRSSVKKLLDKNKVVYQTPAPMEISHHYGLDQFNNFGMSIITLVNNIYCKKLLILLPGQKNPEHYHKEKQETFFVLAGEAIITVDGVENKLVKGGLIHIQPGEVHAISSKSGTVIEELSSTHKTNDSYYVDERINSNNNRKTLIYV